MSETLEDALNLLYSPLTASMLEREAAMLNGPLQFVRSLREAYRGQEVNEELIVSSAAFIEPYDSVLGIDPDTPSAAAFHDGALLGLRASEYILGQSFFDNLNHAPLPFPGARSVKDAEALHHLVAVSLMHFAEQGRAATPAYDPILEAWEDELVSDVRYQLFLKHGLGFMMFVAKRAVIAVDHKAMEAEFTETADIDWSELLT